MVVIPMPGSAGPGILVEGTVSHDGYRFGDFHPQRSPGLGPGWFVFGRNAEKYGRSADGKGRYVTLCGRPDEPRRRRRNYNGEVPGGWRTRREAQAAADAMTAAGA